MINLVVPDIGDFKDVDIIEVLIKEGDRVTKDQSLITLETDKATMEVPSEYEGIVKKVHVKVGDKISQDGLIATIEESKESSSEIKPSSEKQELAQEEPKTPKEEPRKEPPREQRKENLENKKEFTLEEEQAFKNAYASPSVRAMARELGVNLAKVKGSGNKGRITIQDVKDFIKGALQGKTGQEINAKDGYQVVQVLKSPVVDFEKFGNVEIKEQTKIQTISAANLTRNWTLIPHVYYADECDISELENFRKKINSELKDLKISPLAFIIKAVTKTLEEFPSFNASIEENKLILKKYYNIAFAADTKNGLVVPVIKNADQMGVLDIARELTRLSALAREGKLKPTDMQGATFTISSLGGIGLTHFTPIINAPEVAILGVCKSSIKPKWNGQSFEPALICPLILSADHRVIDGAVAARFMSKLISKLSDLKRLSL